MYINIENLKNNMENDNFIAKKLLEGDKNELVYLEIKPFKKIDKHSVNYNTIFYVLEGEGIFVEKEEEFVIKKDSVIKSKIDTPHSVTNTKDIPLKILVVKFK